MVLRAVEFHHLAERELEQARRWYRRRGPAPAQRFLQAVDEVIQRIASAAEQGSPYQQRFRWMKLKRFPYLLHYEIRDPQPVLIYAVAHERRRPGYWKRRARP
jgi:plasmid stabilization system protein ParE